jgi:N-acetylneuraminate synthase
MKPYIIAEIGSNWKKLASLQRCLDVAYNQITWAKEYGASAVKFQLFTAEELYGPNVKGMKLEAETNKFALPRDWVPLLKAQCVKEGIDFLCTGFSIEGYEFIDEYVEMHKIASPELFSSEISTWAFKQPKPVMYSNGCGGTSNAATEGHDILMACVSNYPARITQYSLDLSEWGEKNGISDHTLNSDLAVLARRSGYDYFEKHVDFMTHIGSITPDSVVSCDRGAFKDYVKAINAVDSRVDFKTYLKSSYGRTDSGFRPIPAGAL